MNANLDDDGAEILANSIATNKTLRCLVLKGCTLITGMGWDALFSVLCSTHSIDGTLKANHTFESLWKESDEDGHDLDDSDNHLDMYGFTS